MQVQKLLGVSDHNRAYENVWEANGFPTINRGVGDVTISRQGALRDEEVRDDFTGFAKNHINKALERAKNGEIESKAMDEGAISDVTPLVFDPEFLAILKDNAPLVERVPEEGQNGFDAHYIRIDSRDDPIGFVSENESLDLTGEDRSGVGFERGTTPMKIWVDLVEISEFAAAASEFFFDVRETTLGERVAEHGQTKEVNMLYGDPDQGGDDGGAGDSEAYEGFAKIIEDAGNLVDKSTFDPEGAEADDDEPFATDIKAEIADMVQSENNVVPGDLELWVSHTMFDTLENEMDVKSRVGRNENGVNFGFEFITIKGIEIFPSHSIDEHTFDADEGDYEPGDPGDVFIMNRREMRFRSLMPLSTIPLARFGFGEIVAMGEFGAPILRGEGNLCRYLQAYDI